MKVLLYGTEAHEAEVIQKMGQVFIVLGEGEERREIGPWESGVLKLVEASPEEQAQLDRAGFRLLPADD